MQLDDGRDIREIDLLDDDVDAISLAQLGRQRLHLLDAARHQNKRPTLCGVLPGELFAETTRRARDEHPRLIVQCHDLHLLFHLSAALISACAAAAGASAINATTSLTIVPARSKCSLRSSSTSALITTPSATKLAPSRCIRWSRSRPALSTDVTPRRSTSRGFSAGALDQTRSASAAHRPASVPSSVSRQAPSSFCSVTLSICVSPSDVQREGKRSAKRSDQRKC